MSPRCWCPHTSHTQNKSNRALHILTQRKEAAIRDVVIKAKPTLLMNRRTRKNSDSSGLPAAVGKVQSEHALPAAWVLLSQTGCRIHSLAPLLLAAPCAPHQALPLWGPTITRLSPPPRWERNRSIPPRNYCKPPLRASASQNMATC